jgi:hypothetical protein
MGFVAGIGAAALAAIGVWSFTHKAEKAPEPPIAVASAPAPAPEVQTPAPAPVAEPAPSPAPAPVPRKAVRAKRPSPAPPAPVAVTNSAPAPPPPAPVAAPEPPKPAPAETVRVTPVETPRSTPPPEPPAAPPAPKPREPHTVTIPAGTLLTVRMNDDLSSSTTEEGYTFRASLAAPLVIDGFVIAERGGVLTGRVNGVTRSGRVKGRGRLAVELTELTTADHQRIGIHTETFEQLAQSGVKKDTTKVAVATGIGAAIGAIIGGGKGAAIGAASGGAAGTGGVLATRGEEAKLPVESRISFRLSQPVTVTEKLH